MAKLFKNLEGKVSEVVKGIQKTYPEEEEPEHLTPDDHRKLRIMADVFLIGGSAISAGLGMYTKYVHMKVLWYFVSGIAATTYIIPKIYYHYKMKEQCKDCRHEIINVEKLYKESGISYGQSIGPCTLFKPNQMMLNCSQHKKYDGK